MTDSHAVPSSVVGNLRDIGGRPTSDGRVVARGVAYRSAELSNPATADDPDLARLGIRTVVDLRTHAEREANPDVVPAGAEFVTLDVLADLPGRNAAEIPAMIADPARLAQALGGADIGAAMTHTYGAIVTTPSARRAYAQFARLIGDPDCTPLLFHCTAGKDRTGWAATILLLAAGVDEGGALEEYLSVNPAVRAMFAPVLGKLADAGIDPELLAPAFEVRAEFLQAALTAMHASYGDFEGYLTDGLGLAPDERAALRQAMRV